MPRLKLPDGSERLCDGARTPGQMAASLGEAAAGRALGARVDGELVDLDHPLSEDAMVVLVQQPAPSTPLHEQDPDALWLLRHSTAHVMAEVIQRLWPEALLAYGPPVESGYYYDIALEEPISSDDFARIEEEMRAIVAEARPFTRYELGEEEGIRKLEAEGNKYKLDNARRALETGGKVLSWYATGRPQKHWEDLCAGPHLPSTDCIGAFKLTSVAASHWHGDVRSDRFQRVYGMAFFTPQNLAEHLERMEAAKQRDHRVIGRALGLFIIDEQVGPGLVLWKPRGAVLRTVLQDFLQGELLRRGYEMVYTPHIGRIELYKTSGHYPYYAESQYPPIQMRDSDEQYLLRPMNCPNHIKIYASEPRSYRQLPVRLAEFGTVYRHEQSGELTGMIRVRGFTQDDAHIFCTPEQVASEFRSTLDLVRFLLETFDFKDFQVRLGLRDPNSDKYVGELALWDRAERELREVLKESGLEYTEEVGEAAFYGPKTDFLMRDAIGRRWQLGTVQLDYNLPERFALEYIGPDNAPHRPVMIHRAPFGSMERFVAILIEHYAGAFPLWLSPEQVWVLPVSQKFSAYGEKVLAALKDAGLRAVLDDSSERLGAKIRTAQQAKVPYMLVVGGRDESAGTVAVRCRSRGDLGTLSLDAFLEQAGREARTRGAETVFG